MKNILAVDTATQMLIVSLKHNNQYYTEIVNEGFTHSENIIPTIEKTLKKANLTISELDLLICSRGPGSFTGLRISMSTLKGISLGLNIPLVSVPTLDIYGAQEKSDSCYTVPVIDARKKRFYCSIYLNGKKVSDYLDLTPDEIVDETSDKNVIFTGPDCQKLSENIADNNKLSIAEVNYDSYSKNIIEMGLNQYKEIGADKMDQGPVYIRKSEAEIHLENKKS